MKGSMKKALRILLLLAACLLLAAGSGRSHDEPVASRDEPVAPDTGDERIRSFHSEITVLPDASLFVRETIRVRAAQRGIKHGIYRDFPTRFRSSEGIWFNVPFSLTEVLRDGKPEPWQTKERENGIRAYIGDADLLLEPGEYAYTIAYRTDRQLGFFNDHVELVWNVTGYEWTLPIDEVEARVVLPQGVSGVSLEVSTGVRGSKEREAAASWGGEAGASFRATRPFQPGEGLAVTVKWPKGFVREPAEPQLWWWYFLGSNRSAVAGLAGLLLVLTYYILVGRQVARDPERGVIVPRGEVPEGLSPAAIRVVRTGKCDERALAATLVQMAIKGFLVIEERGGKFTLRRGEAGRAVLAPEEALVANDLSLERVEQVGIESANNALVGGAVNGLKNFLRASLERFYLLRNREFLLPGVALSVIVLGATLTLEPGLRSFTRGLTAMLLFFWTIGVSLLVIQIEYRWHDVLLRRGHRRDTLYHAASITVFAIPFLIAEIVGLGLIIWLGSYSYGVVLLGVAFLNAHFHYLFKAPASVGRRLLDRIEGFEVWLAAAETDGMCRFGPEPSPEVYERFLPYAIALDREVQWSLQCAVVLARGGEGGRGYQPAWCRSDSAVAGGSPAPCAKALGDALSSAIASSAVAPAPNQPAAVNR
jgi:hypothetical protein